MKKGENISGSLTRPSTLEMGWMPFGEDPTVINAMEACWAEDPALRPDFTTLKTSLKRMK